MIKEEQQKRRKPTDLKWRYSGGKTDSRFIAKTTKQTKGRRVLITVDNKQLDNTT